ncbi:nuclear transport factor 2 family protein [Hymenobacter sp. BT635]|uniref:Nuclear transport factor 2 family protein n=2 Tax=Hymenobacter TaxID=89966 RepID=A0A4Z0Q1G6_9BACT|nr:MULTISPECIES: nuclear transport factor 2 family protein [Hymenobacter]MCB2379946.1 nuclear transport factor 2 family protein [Hymenobacter nitidus]TGE23366.1 nuclear transport factor 2 family protein [Hymenobacter metallicola]
MKSLLWMMPLTVVLASSCTKTAETPATAVNAQTLNQQFISAWNSKNAIQLDTLFADDVHFLQGETHFQGKSEVSNRWVRETMGTISNLRLNVASSGTDAQTAYEGGTYVVDVIPTTPGTPMGVGEGNFILLWKKNPKGAWKLSYAQLEGLPVRVR